MASVAMGLSILALGLGALPRFAKQSRFMVVFVSVMWIGFGLARRNQRRDLLRGRQVSEIEGKELAVTSDEYDLHRGPVLLIATHSR